MNALSDPSKPTPKVARCLVLLAAFNGTRWIDEQVISILDQEGVDVEIIVNVDRSEDNTYERAIDWQNSDSRVSTLEYGARYGGAAPNFFHLIRNVNTSGFDLIAFADQDDIWLPNKLVNAWHLLNNGNFHAYSSDVMAFWPSGRRSLIKKSYPQRRYDHFFESAGPGCTFVLKTEVFSAVQLFVRERFNECRKVALHDWLVYAFCRHHQYRWVIDNRALMMYRQHGSNQFGSNSGVRDYLARVRMIKEGWYVSEVRKIVSLVAPELVDKVSSRGFVLANFWSCRRRVRDRLVLLICALVGLL